jgi:hypothetical protein
MMQEGGVILDIVLYVGICFVFGVFDLEIYFWCVVGCYSSTSRKSVTKQIDFNTGTFFFTSYHNDLCAT